MTCRECKYARFAAEAAAIGDYYICRYDNKPRRGIDDCNISYKYQAKAVKVNKGNAFN